MPLGGGVVVTAVVVVEVEAAVMKVEVGVDTKSKPYYG